MTYHFYDCGCFDAEDKPVDRATVYCPAESISQGFEKVTSFLAMILRIPPEGVHISGVRPAEEEGMAIRCVFSMLDRVPVATGRRRKRK